MNVIKVARAHLQQSATAGSGLTDEEIISDFLEDPWYEDEVEDEADRVAIAQHYASTFPTVRNHIRRWFRTIAAYICSKPSAKCTKCKVRTSGFKWPVICPVCAHTYCSRCYGGARNLFYNKGCYKCARVVERIEFLNSFVLVTLEKGSYVLLSVADTVPEAAIAVSHSETVLWDDQRPHRAICGNQEVLLLSNEILLPVDMETRYDTEPAEPVAESGWLFYDVDLNTYKFRSVCRPNNVPKMEVAIPNSSILAINYSTEDHCMYITSSVQGAQVTHRINFQDRDTGRQWALYCTLAWELLSRESLPSIYTAF